MKQYDRNKSLEPGHVYVQLPFQFETDATIVFPDENIYKDVSELQPGDMFTVIERHKDHDIQDAVCLTFNGIIGYVGSIQLRVGRVKDIDE